jgi:predicted GNAT family acetyltransferase
MPDEAAVLVTDALAEVLAVEGLSPERDVEGFNGAAEAARMAVGRWQQMFPQVSVTTTVPVRLHRLDRLAAPDVPGKPRVATAADLGAVEPWHLGFAADVGHPVSSMDGTMRLRMRRRSLLLWTVDDEPVSMAGHTPVAGGVTRIGPVYTPPEHRRHGYGAAVTAAASVAAQAQPGAEQVTLFTDLRNPTSNKIYAEIGFRPVGDYLEIGFATGP